MGAANSVLYPLQILVNSTNDPPVIVGLVAPLTTNESQPITLELGDLDVTDPDNPYPTGFTLTVLPGSNYAVSGTTTVTPEPNFNGVLKGRGKGE